MNCVMVKTKAYTSRSIAADFPTTSCCCSVSGQTKTMNSMACSGFRLNGSARNCRSSRCVYSSVHLKTIGRCQPTFHSRDCCRYFHGPAGCYVNFVCHRFRHDDRYPRQSRAGPIRNSLRTDSSRTMHSRSGSCSKDRRRTDRSSKNSSRGRNSRHFHNRNSG